MVELLGEHAWVAILAAAIGAFLAPIIGYFRRPRNGPSQSTMQGSMMIDSSVAREALEQLTDQADQTRRMADAAEGLLEVEHSRDKRESQDRHDSELETLRRKVEDLERDKR